MKHLIDVLEWLLGTSIARTILVIIIAVIVTIWFTRKLVDFRDDLRGQFAKTHQMMHTQLADIRTEIKAIRDEAWTVKMQGEYARIIADWNPTNKIPDPFRIYRDLRDGKAPIPIRIGPQ